ncbi:DUF3757 domain-containing protein [Pseudomonas paralactis]|uniref:DUF3757 domain-containing protein n=1 Tax=Pseudomonas paralactis TaxID=1615673 RepID=UPI001648671D|nr:DUF3757 domain-containing protein [Pseudomonas paralactis]MBC3256900.1 DUF3757 domain-containing protein [Pseudomonas paralactis]
MVFSVRLFIWCGVILSPLLSIMAAQASSKYFDIPAWPGDEESCPAPGNIHSSHGVFRAPAKSEGVDWVGMSQGDVGENVLAFTKAIFVLAEQNSESRGFLASCIYRTSAGRYLSMRLDGNEYGHIMWIARSASWRQSQDFSSKTILECTDKGTRACGFFIK